MVINRRFYRNFLPQFTMQTSNIEIIALRKSLNLYKLQKF